MTKKYPTYKNSNISWIGDVPSHWGRMRYKDVLISKDIKVGSRTDLTLLSLTKNGVIVRDLSEGKGKFPKDFESYKEVFPNNLILCLFDVDETPRTVGIAQNHGMITGAYDVFEIQNIDLQYFYYLYLSFDDAKLLKPLYKGLRKTIPLPNLLSSYLPVPPLPEQTAIVNFLDDKCSRIDTFVTSKEKQIALLKEYKQSFIADAVTKGINKNVKFKDSGISWIGDIPEHWEVKRLGRILKKERRERKPNSELLVCSNSGKVLKRGDAKMGLVASSDEIFQGVSEGDLLIHGMDTWHGAIAVSKLNGMCTPVVHVCSSNQNKEFVANYMRYLAIGDFYKAITNGIRQNTSDFRCWDKVAKLQIPIPPLAEQQAIVEHINAKVSSIDTMVDKLQKQIDLIKEYKQSLIADVVTGKICVTD